jgi:hypothetical protein
VTARPSLPWLIADRYGALAGMPKPCFLSERTICQSVSLRRSYCKTTVMPQGSTIVCDKQKPDGTRWEASAVSFKPRTSTRISTSQAPPTARLGSLKLATRSFASRRELTVLDIDSG